MIAILSSRICRGLGTSRQCSCSARCQSRGATNCAAARALPSPHCAAFCAAARSTRPCRRAICAAADWVGAESLPRWARWWDNDVSINGDHQVPATLCRHARGPRSVLLRAGPPPRSFHARWCGWACATGPVRSPQCLARKLTPAEVQDADTWGDEKPSARQRRLVRAATGLCTSSTSSARSARCACVCTTATSSTTPESGAPLQWWSTSALA